MRQTDMTLDLSAIMKIENIAENWRAHELFSFPVSGLIAGAKKLKERPDEIKRVHRDFDGSSGWP